MSYGSCHLTGFKGAWSGHEMFVSGLQRKGHSNMSASKVMLLPISSIFGTVCHVLGLFQSLRHKRMEFCGLNWIFVLFYVYIYIFIIFTLGWSSGFILTPSSQEAWMDMTQGNKPIMITNMGTFPQMPPKALQLILAQWCIEHVLLCGRHTTLVRSRTRTFKDATKHRPPL